MALELFSYFFLMENNFLFYSDEYVDFLKRMSIDNMLLYFNLGEDWPVFDGLDWYLASNLK